MTCGEIHALIWRREDGELAGEEVAVLESHLVACRACAGRARAAATLGTMIAASLAPERHPHLLAPKVLARLAAAEAAPPPPVLSICAALAASTLAQYAALEYFAVSLNDGLVLVLGLGVLKDLILGFGGLWTLLSEQAAAVPSPWIAPALAASAVLSLTTRYWMIRTRKEELR